MQDFHRIRGNKDSTLGGQTENLLHTKTQGKGAVTLQETEPDIFAGVGRSPVEAWGGSSSTQGPRHVPEAEFSSIVNHNL